MNKNHIITPIIAEIFKAMSNEENNTEEVVESKPFSVLGYIEDNSKNLMYAGIALLVVAAGFWYYTSVYTPKRNAAANDELFRAEKVLRARLT